MTDPDFILALPPPFEGIQTAPFADMQDSDVCPREEIVEKLSNLLCEICVVHVRGTPASGKSFLAKLLHNTLLVQNRPVLTLPFWDRSPPYGSAIDYLTAACRAANVAIPSNGLGACEATIILDEAQTSYKDKTLWNNFIKPKHDQNSGLRLCLFSSYGSPASGVDYGSLGSEVGLTPANFNPRQRISLVPHEDGPGFGLFYTQAECRNAIQRFRFAGISQPSFHEDALAQIFLLTNGHPGMVKSFLKYLEESYRSALKSGHLNFSRSHILSVLNDRKSLVSKLGLAMAGRGLPIRNRDSRLTNPSVVRVLRHVLVHQSVPFDPADVEMDLCFKQGWIQRDMDREGNYCTFPTPLHAMYAEFEFGISTASPFPSSNYSSPQELLLHVIKEYSKRRLQAACQGTRRGASGVLRPKEAAFTDEFYTCYNELLDFAGEIVGQWQCGDGAIDYFVREPRWGFEFLRHGDRLEEHLSRFRNNGTYYKDIQSTALADWLVVDCRTSMPRKQFPNEPKLLRAVFLEKYDSVLFLDCMNKEIMPKLCLRT